MDRFTNYRYYSASQLPRLNRILALKGLGLSLDQIGRLLENDLPPEQIRGMLRLKQIEIRERLDQEQARLALVEQRLEQIEQEEAMPREEVAIKDIPSQTVASVRDTIPSMEHIDQLFGEIFAYLGQQKLNRRWLRRSSRMTSTGGGWNRPSSFTTSPPGVRRMSRV